MPHIEHEYGPDEVPKYAFCESVAAGSLSKWHIRAVTPTVGLKLGGGIDTSSLCGRVDRGWDLSARITERHLSHACPVCVAAYKNAV